jgi:predicted phage terminase large subunit-like protein
MTDLGDKAKERFLRETKPPEVEGVKIDWSPLPHPAIRDLRGMRFGKLLVKAYSHTREQANGIPCVYWLCQCDCGNDRPVARDQLLRKGTSSCGCLSVMGNKGVLNASKTHQKRSHMTKRMRYGLPPVPPTEVIGDPANVFAYDSLMAYACLQWAGYVPAAHHHLIAKYLEKVEKGKIKRLMIFMPPRSGKSMIVSEFFPAWYLGRNPDKRIIAASYGQELASDFGRKVRNQIADPVYSEIFPGVALAEDSAAVDKFNLAPPHQGGYFAVGVGSATTGRGGSLIIDDPTKGREEADSETNRRKMKDWFSSVAYTRLPPNGFIIICLTRWHLDDLAGWLLKEHKHEKWTVLNLPAINDKGEALWPERFPLETLHQIKKTLTARDWEALYQQKPFIEEGGIFKRQWWKIWPDTKPFPECEFIIQSYDTAYSDKDLKSNSYSARTTWGVFKRADDECHNLILLEAWKGHVEYPDLRKEAMRAYGDYEPDKVIIEKKASGQSLVQDLRRAGLPIATYTPTKDKVTRAYIAQSLFENGRVYYPSRQWAEDVITDLCQFPQGAHDDLVDTVSMAFIWLQSSFLVSHADDAKRRQREDEEDEDLPSNVTRFKPKKKRAAYG